MKLYKAEKFVEDSWTRLEDGQAASEGEKNVVSLARWRSERVALVEVTSGIGVWLEPGEEIDLDGDNASQLGVVIIPFAKFTDGRGYSIARSMRDFANYAGEIRATGDVLLDQMPLMLRCGFDAFEIESAPTIRALENGHLPALQNVYQRPTAGPASVAGRHFELGR